MNLPLVNTAYVGQDELCKDNTHGECNHELFCVTGKDSDHIDIEDLV